MNILRPFFIHLSAVTSIDSRQRGNGGIQIVGEFLRDVLDSFLKARQKQSVSEKNSLFVLSPNIYSILAKTLMFVNAQIQLLHGGAKLVDTGVITLLWGRVTLLLRSLPPC